MSLCKRVKTVNTRGMNLERDYTIIFIIVVYDVKIVFKVLTTLVHILKTSFLY